MKKILLSAFVLIHCFVFAQEQTRTRLEPVKLYPPIPEPVVIKSDKSISDGGTTNSIGVAFNIPSASPEVQRANSLQDIPVNLYTGAPIVNIPIATISEGRLTVPIGLNYAHSQVKPHTVSGWTGLGWELIGVPMISRMVRGFPDEGSLSNNVGQKGYFFYGNSIVPTNESQDKEPDIYFLNTPSGSYKFMFDSYRKAHFFPETDIKVEISFINNPNESGSNHFARIFTQFLVKLPDGTKYFFSRANVEETAEVDVKEAQNNGYYPLGSNFLSFLNNRLLVSAWYCSKIESPYGEVINFSYDRFAYTYYKLAENKEDYGCPTTVSKKLNKVYVRGSQISEITSTHQKIAFNTGIKSCTTDYTVSPPETICTFIGGTRYDIDSWGNAPTGSSASKILLSIDVSDNEINPSIKSSLYFNYGYLEGADYGLPSGYSYTDIGQTHKKKLKLSTVTFPDGSNYKFNYNDEDGNIQNRLSYGVDHWGGANGLETNLNGKGLIGADEYLPSPSCGSNRSVNLVEAKKGVLSKISHSMGSETIFEYESNVAKNYSLTAGGLRIKNIINKDLIRNISTKKLYSYTLADNSTSGFMFVKPVYRVSDGFNVFSHSDLYLTLLAESGRPPVGYSRVTEELQSADQSIVLGKTVTTFDQDETEGTIKQIPSCTSNCVFNPVYFKLQHDFKQGQTLKQEVFNASSTLIQKSEFEYTVNAGIKFDSTLAWKTFKQVYTGGNYSIGIGYYQLFRKYRTEAQTSFQYSRDGSGAPIINNTTFTYKDEMPQAYKNIYKGKHNQLVKTQTTDEEGVVIELFQKYVADFVFDNDTTIICDPDCPPEYSCADPYCDVQLITEHIPAAGTEARAIFESQDKNLIYLPIESIQKMNGQAVSAMYVSYFAEPAIYTSLPSKSYALKNIPKASFADVYFRKSDDEMVKDTDYGVPLTEMISYNSKGMVLSSRQIKGSINTTSYNSSGLLPISKTMNPGKPDVQSASVEYGKVFQGIQKKIQANQTELRYEYNNTDATLEVIKDKDGQILNIYKHDLVPIGPGASFISWDNSQRTKLCVGGQITQTVYITGLVAGTTVEFSTNGGSTWQAANVGASGYSYTASPSNSYQSFQARASDNLANVITTQYHSSCSTVPPMNWSTYSVNSAGSGVCNYFVSVTGQAIDSFAEFSVDNTNWIRANVGDSGMNFSLLQSSTGFQDFWFRPAESPSTVTYGVLTTCN
jgi:hypothetical protein